MKTSIALCLYKAERNYLRAQLDSLKDQTLPPDEVILFDDGSDDALMSAFVSGYIQENSLTGWKLVAAKENSGYIKAFQNALSRCSNDLIFLCDQDDMWHPDKLQKLAELFEKHPDMKGVLSSFDMIDAHSLPIESAEHKRRLNHGMIRKKGSHQDLIALDAQDLVMTNAGPGCTAAFRKETVDRYLQTPSCRLPHDWALYLHAAVQGGMYFYNEPLISYRLHGNNTIGLSRTRSLLKRQTQAFDNAMQKQEIIRILEQNASSALEAAKKAQHLLDQRAHALHNRSIGALLGLIPKGISFPGFEKTLLYDIQLIMTDRNS